VSAIKAVKNAVSRAIFERRYGIDTGDHVEADELGYSDPDNVGYEPSGWLTLHRALAPSSVTGDDVFADLGCGKGRVVLQAAISYGFKRVIGVELSPDLAAAARANVERNRKRFRAVEVEIDEVDVLSWEIPEDLSVVYLHNPFTGELFSKATERLAVFARRRGRALRLVYVNPIEHDRLIAAGAFPLPTGEGLRARVMRVDPEVVRWYVFPA
jgi:SAM-dependent methyltransferase